MYIYDNIINNDFPFGVAWFLDSPIEWRKWQTNDERQQNIPYVLIKTNKNTIRQM